MKTPHRNLGTAPRAAVMASGGRGRSAGGLALTMVAAAALAISGPMAAMASTIELKPGGSLNGQAIGPDQHGITVQLLADKEGEACQAYGVWQEKEKDGVKRMGIVRSTFVVDKKGVIRHALYGVQSKGHAEEILELVKEMK